MVVVDGEGLPLGNHFDSASPGEVTLVEKTLRTVAVPRGGPGRPRNKPRRLIADRGYNSDPLRNRLARRGIELICPHRRGRRRAPIQDGRPLRRYSSAGKSSGLLRGLVTTSDLSPAGSGISQSIERSSISHAC